MSPAQTERLAAVVETALERPPATWAAFLDAACAGDAALRAEAVSLLQNHDAARVFIERSPVAPAALDGLLRDVEGNHGGGDAEENDHLPAGARLGDFEVLSLLGEGGMGEVYLARDAAPLGGDRRVALKVVRRGGPSWRRRFGREARILAALTHPHVARLYGGAVSADGIPFLVMEYVEGERLDRHCDRLRLDVPARLALFRTLCGAVAHAHANLVVHRDLKPANILVTAAGEPKLLDFGIARLLDAGDGGPGGAPAATATGLPLALTPDYASPEQIRGETLTTATDVYSLGVNPP